MGCPVDGHFVVVAAVLTSFLPFPPLPRSGPAITGLGFGMHPNSRLAIYKPDGRHTTEQIPFHHMTPVRDTFRPDTDSSLSRALLLSCQRTTCPSNPSHNGSPSLQQIIRCQSSIRGTDSVPDAKGNWNAFSMFQQR